MSPVTPHHKGVFNFNVLFWNKHLRPSWHREGWLETIFVFFAIGKSNYNDECNIKPLSACSLKLATLYFWKFSSILVLCGIRGARWPHGQCVSACNLGSYATLVIGWVTNSLLSQAPPCFGRNVKQLVPAAFAVVSTHQPALGPRGGLWPVLLVCNP
jgi:hypothetical protein